MYSTSRAIVSVTVTHMDYFSLLFVMYYDKAESLFECFS